MKLSYTVSTIGCANYLNELARKVGKPPRKVILFEGAKIIGQCIAKTPFRSKEKIEKQINFRNRTLWDNGDPERPKDRGSFVAGFAKSGEGWLFETSNWDGTGRKPRVISGKSFHLMTEFFHWSDPRWARWQAHLAAMRNKQHNVKQAVASRGVSKQTWYQMAVDLGIAHLVTPKPPGYVVTARSRDGRSYKHGSGRKFDSATFFYIEIANDSNLVVNRLNGANILHRAIENRRRYFMNNVKRGVFDEIANISRRYNGITLL